MKFAEQIVRYKEENLSILSFYNIKNNTEMTECLCQYWYVCGITFIFYENQYLALLIWKNRAGKMTTTFQRHSLSTQITQSHVVRIGF